MRDRDGTELKPGDLLESPSSDPAAERTRYRLVALGRELAVLEERDGSERVLTSANVANLRRVEPTLRERSDGGSGYEFEDASADTCYLERESSGEPRLYLSPELALDRALAGELGRLLLGFARNGELRVPFAETREPRELELPAAEVRPGDVLLEPPGSIAWAPGREETVERVSRTDTWSLELDLGNSRIRLGLRDRVRVRRVSV